MGAPILPTLVVRSDVQNVAAISYRSRLERLTFCNTSRIVSGDIEYKLEQVAAGHREFAGS